MEDCSNSGGGDGGGKVSLDYRRRTHQNKKRTSVQGLCLFCNSNFPRPRPYPLGIDKPSNIPKFRRAFAFLAAELGVQIQDKKSTSSQTEFSFISERVPLCSSCLELLDQVNLQFLRLQTVKFQLNKIVGKIRASIIKSRSNSTPVYTEVELLNESHFDAFRRHVEEEDRPPHPCDLKISLPNINLERLKPAEIEKHTKRRRIEVEEPVDAVNDFNFSNLIQEIEEESNDFGGVDFIIGALDDDEDEEQENDVKPNISELNSGIKVMQGSEESQINVDDIATELIQLQFEIEVPYESDPPTNPATPTSISVTIPTVNQTIITPAPKKKRQRTIYPKELDEDSCKLCSIAFKTQKELADHYRSNHPGEFPKHCPEPGCAYGALMNNAIRKHIFMKHTSDEVRDSKKNMVCEECGKRFFSSKNLKHHMLMHQGLRPFSCGQCSKKFRCQQALDVHVFRIHENVRKFLCPHCPWKFKDPVTLKGHIALHTGEKNYSCHICVNRKFIQHHALKSHWKVHKQNGDWVEPSDFNKQRRGWVRKSKRETESTPECQPTQQNRQEQGKQPV